MATGTELAPGAVLAGYRIEAQLGRGGMSVVYLAEDLRLKRRVALKLLDPRLAEDAAFRDRFVEESELAASLDHPHIVPIYEAGDADGRLFISMRYVDGSDLRSRSRGAPLAPDVAVSLLGQVASALDAAHARGLVHGDVKPSNVLIAPAAAPDGSDHAYVADFGLSKRIAPGSGMAMGPQVAGTIDYVAPEQIRGEDVDGRADLYSLACLLYECLTGAPPFRRDSDVALLFAHLEEPPPPATDRQPELPSAIDGVLARALAKSPGERYGSGAELVEAARDALGLGQPAKPARRIAAIAAAALVAAAGVAAFFLARGHPTPPPSTTGSVLRLDARTGRKLIELPVGNAPSAMATTPRTVWVANSGDNTVSRIDTSTLRVKPIPVNGSPVSVAVSDGVVIVASGPPTRSLTLIKAATGGAYDTLPLPGSAAKDSDASPLVASGAHSLWLGNKFAWNVVRIDTRGVGPVVAKSIALEAGNALGEVNDIATGDGAAWVVGNAANRRLWRIDWTTNRVAAIRLRLAPRRLAVGEGGVWITGEIENRLVRVDPVTRRVVASIRVGRGAGGVAAGAGSVWVANRLDGTVSRIDPSRNAVTDTIRVGGHPEDVAAVGTNVWVTEDRS